MFYFRSVRPDTSHWSVPRLPAWLDEAQQACRLSRPMVVHLNDAEGSLPGYIEIRERGDRAGAEGWLRAAARLAEDSIDGFYCVDDHCRFLEGGPDLLGTLCRAAKRNALLVLRLPGRAAGLLDFEQPGLFPAPTGPAGRVSVRMDDRASRVRRRPPVGSARTRDVANLFAAESDHGARDHPAPAGARADAAVIDADAGKSTVYGQPTGPLAGLRQGLSGRSDGLRSVVTAPHVSLDLSASTLACGRPRRIGQRASLDLAAPAKALAQEDAGRRGSVDPRHVGEPCATTGQTHAHAFNVDHLDTRVSSTLAASNR